MFSAALGTVQPAQAQYVQQGPKLVGSGPVGAAQEGSAAALSADGNTAIIGGRNDNSNAGAIWVFTRSDGIWTQQGPKLVGAGAVGPAALGFQAAISADGNTAITSGYTDNSNAGAAWIFIRDSGAWVQQGSKLVGNGGFFGTGVALSADGNTAIVGAQNDGTTGAAFVFTRSSGVWTQQGPKLVPTGASGNPGLGTAVALSADGNTALVGGLFDAMSMGAAWVFTRSGNTWTQQGLKLVGSGGTAGADQGASVALSADGNTAVIGGPGDSSGAGATWIFTRSGSTWSQQGLKLVGTGSVQPSTQGAKVALSADGNTLIMGGYTDNSSAGAAWIFTRSGTTWSQRGAKLVGSGAVGPATQGLAVAMSGDRRTALVGGIGDVSSVGATWAYALVGPHDLNTDGMSDVVWRNAEGDVAVWLMNGTQITPGPVYGPISAAWSIVGQRDFNGDGKADLLWSNTNGDVSIWLMNGTTVSSAVDLGVVGNGWTIVGNGDFNGDGHGDILWRNSNGDSSIWLMTGTATQVSVLSAVDLGLVPTSWSVARTGDFNGDGKTDILWRNTNGDTSIWLMTGNGTQVQVSSMTDIGLVPLSWTIAGTGDFNGDGTSDILWHNSNGDAAIWLMTSNGTQVQVSSTHDLGVIPTSWGVALTGDFNGDTMSDILWRNTNGDTSLWFMSGAAVSSVSGLGVVPTSWVVQGAGAD